MALKQRLTEEELALVEVIEDPIWLNEFLRNTANGDIRKETWPPTPFKHRWYQKDLLTDKTPHVVLTGGRAIGKCAYYNDYIYTSKGYKQVKELSRIPAFLTYALDDNGNTVLRRAKVYPDKKVSVYKVVTDRGHVCRTTLNHPYLTPDGWVKLKDLKVGDRIATVTRLPALDTPPMFSWPELRVLGYTLLMGLKPAIENPIQLRYAKQVAEYEAIAKAFDCTLIHEDSRLVRLKRKNFYIKNNITWLLGELGIDTDLLSINGYHRLPDVLMEQPNESIKIFLEAAFSLYGTYSKQAISIPAHTRRIAYQIQELLLRFGIVSSVALGPDESGIVSITDPYDVYLFWASFSLPGVAVNDLAEPVKPEDYSNNLRWATIETLSLYRVETQTYAVYVYDYHNYIQNNCYVHNTLFYEDKTTYEVVNAEIEFPITKESAIFTPNQAQLTPLLDRLITKFTSSPLLKHYLKNNVNKSQGILKFPATNPPFILNARIAGAGNSNTVGLHMPKYKIDEAQLFQMSAYEQLQPALNSWEPKIQEFVTGVPNGLRTSILYQADQRLSKFKRYRVPSHNNPYYTRDADISNIKQYGGESSDSYQQLNRTWLAK